ncbi:hypothetical protein [Acetobacterium sp.]|nr:hypothetical protein [Acetobacterium sp.]MDO9492650.1 hypothetical protein [Acetobacterium sp.]
MENINIRIEIKENDKTLEWIKMGCSQMEAIELLKKSLLEVMERYQQEKV